MSKKHLVGTAVILSIAFLVSGPVMAEDSEVTVKAGSRYLMNSDVSNMDGEIEVTESKFSLKHKDKISGQLPFDINLNVKHIDINEDLAVDLPSHLEYRSIGVSTKFPAPCVDSDEFFVGVDVDMRMNTDDWDWETSAVRIPFRAYLIYKPEEKFVFVCGVAVRPDYDATVLPIVGMIYKPDDRWSFNFASSEPSVTYKVDDKLTAVMEFDYALDEYEVSRGLDRGVVLKYRQASTGFGLQYEMAEDVTGLFSVGGVFGRRLEYEDDNGKVEPDAAVYLKAKLEAKF